MRRYVRLDRLSHSTERRLRRLQGRARQVRVAGGTLKPSQFEAEVSFVVIELLNMWSNAAKWYFVSCARGARSSQGQQIHSALALVDDNDAVGAAVRVFHPGATPSGATGLWDRRDEPSWHDPNTLVRLSSAAHLSNAVTISGSFGLGAKVFRDLPVFRNYFAHRNRETRMAAQRIGRPYGVNTLQNPSKILCEVPVGRGASVLEEWIDEISATIRLLCG